MRILGIVTLFNPPAAFVENVMSYAPHVEGLYLWDNTPGLGAQLSLPADIAAKVACRRQGRNVGIAKAFNDAAAFALEKGYTHLLTMNQDCRFEPGTFEAYRHAIEADNDPLHYAFTPRINRPATDGGEVRECGGMIVAGTVFTARCLREVGAFMENLVIDAVDTEYLLRIHRCGGKVMEVAAGSLAHEVGHPLRRRILFFRPVSLNYPPIRTFYIARNLLYLRRTYPEFRRRDLMWTLVWKRPLYILFIEPDKGAKLAAWARGVWLGLRGRLQPDPYYRQL